ncbi:hypothetical protein F5879DRAFT_45791 [Lentinula edodes]|nr:hypothetical protein F5879DRAFT_45791 [Lentinula edodes]
MKDGQSFGYQEFFSPCPRALVSEYAFRPVSYSTINPTIVYPESMVNLIGGGHVRRRRSGFLVEASPIVRTVNQLDNRRFRVDDPFIIYALQNVLPHHPSAMRASCPVQSRVRLTLMDLRVRRKRTSSRPSPYSQAGFLLSRTLRWSLGWFLPTQRRLPN